MDKKILIEKKAVKVKKETSKVLLLFVCLVSLILISIIIYAWVVFDRTDAAALAGIALAPAVTVIGFYSWKAKNENLLKIREYMRCNNLMDEELLGYIKKEEDKLMNESDE